MKEKSNNKGLIWLIIILFILVLGLGGYIIYDKLFGNEIINNVDTNITTTQKTEEQKNAHQKLSEVLTNLDWIKENLYSKKDCFDQNVENINQKLSFVILYDTNNNPMAIVLNDTSENFIKAIYKVYYANDNILVKNITESVVHPSHVDFSVDVKQGLIIENYAHMGNYTFKAYDIKNDEISIYEEYKCTTGNCNYEYEGEKIYNLSNITIELNSENVYKQLNLNNNVNSQNNINEQQIDNNKIENAIKNALIEKIAKDEYHGIWGYDNSIYAEGHKTLRAEFIDNKIYVYVLAQVGTYTKENDVFDNTSGIAGPFVIVFSNTYEFISYDSPEDGNDETDSLRKLFPSDLVNEATNVDYRTDFYQNQIKNYLD